MNGSVALGATLTQGDFGQLADGTDVRFVELRNENGMSARIITLGATLQMLSVPDRDGASADVVLGFSDPSGYMQQGSYIGASIGRYANRIAGGRFELEGKVYDLEVNSGENHLHGGTEGLDKVNWSIESVSDGPVAEAVLTTISPDGAGGYPGTLTVRVAYRLHEDNALTVEYTASTDTSTIVNLTNHSYFNLAGEAVDADVLNHRLIINAERYTPVDPRLIPTGELRSVENSPFDFRSARDIGSRIDDSTEEQMGFGQGYDHNYVIDGQPGQLRLAARVSDPQSGRQMELRTTAPGIQFYTANFLNESKKGKSGRAYGPRYAFCLEPQAYPDTPNQSTFPSARLDPEETYRSATVLRFSTVPKFTKRCYTRLKQ
jgi:aldose 1-epimerase